MTNDISKHENALVVFQGRKIRRMWFNDEWWFSVVDIIEVLTETGRAIKYWSDLKVKLKEEGFELSEKIGQLKLIAEDGKLRPTDCANTKKEGSLNSEAFARYPLRTITFLSLKRRNGWKISAKSNVYYRYF